MQNSRLTRARETLCKVESHHDQWVLEYNSIEHSAFVVQTAKPLSTAEASLLTWHLCLGHPNADIIDHLPESVIGTKVTKAPIKDECETCSLTKAQAIISWHPSIQPVAYYEHIAFDLIEMNTGYNGN